MNVIFISDNYFLCAGVSGTQLSTRYIRDVQEIDKLDYINPFCDYIVAIEQDSLRNKIIKRVKKLKSKYIVLLNEIEFDQFVKIDNVIYSSLHFNLHPLQQLVRFYNTLRQHNFTRREYDVLKLSHLENHKIAKKLKLSEKTTSTYRVKIQEKLNMRATNMLAMHRIKSAIVDQKFNQM